MQFLWRSEKPERGEKLFRGRGETCRGGGDQNPENPSLGLNLIDETIGAYAQKKILFVDINNGKIIEEKESRKNNILFVDKNEEKRKYYLLTRMKEKENIIC